MNDRLLYGFCHFCKRDLDTEIKLWEVYQIIIKRKIHYCCKVCFHKQVNKVSDEVKIIIKEK